MLNRCTTQGKTITTINTSRKHQQTEKRFTANDRPDGIEKHSLTTIKHPKQQIPLSVTRKRKDRQVTTSRDAHASKATHVARWLGKHTLYSPTATAVKISNGPINWRCLCKQTQLILNNRASSGVLAQKCGGKRDELPAVFGVIQQCRGV